MHKLVVRHLRFLVHNQTFCPLDETENKKQLRPTQLLFPHTCQMYNYLVCFTFLWFCFCNGLLKVYWVSTS